MSFLTKADYESYCEQKTLTIIIPYTNQNTSELLNFKAGTCEDSGTTGLYHNYFYNATSSEAILNVLIDECGLDTRNDDNDSFIVSANITLGAIDGNKELIFYNDLFGAKCGQISDYTVSFTYGDISVAGDIECEVDENGNCMDSAFSTYNFTITEFDSSNYETEATEETRQTVANEFIYLKISSRDLPDYMKE